jgi:hypothetical protein
MGNLHMEGLDDDELVEVADQALASLNARYENPEESNADDPTAAAEMSEHIKATCDAWDRFADFFREPAA